MTSADRRVAVPDERPLRLPWLAQGMQWFPAMMNLIPVAVYAVFVLVPWLVYFAQHGTGPCSIATGCDGPDLSGLPALPGAVWNPVIWPLIFVALVTFLIVATGPVTPLVLGGLTVTGGVLGLFAHRKATLTGGTLMLALGLFQLTTTGAMITAWMVD
jgi:hypothetical protein